MQASGIPFRETGFFSGLIRDYLDQVPQLAPFYGRFPTLQAFRDQMGEKAKQYPMAHREVLHAVLTEQYASLQVSGATGEHLENLRKPNAFTVVTGHQLNLFTGPLYFLYKILTTIKLASRLGEEYPEAHFVPVYWMGSEDHDFDEVNHFNFRGKEIRWNRPTGGAVGRMDTEGLDAVFEQFSKDLGPGTHAAYLKDLFSRAYLQQPTMAAATRFLVNELFGDMGLVILDADDPRLKALFVPHVERDLFENLGQRTVSESISRLNALPGQYRIQVSPRELNFFYLKDGFRERLAPVEGGYGVVDSEIRFGAEAVRGELHAHPERFSPNVVTRPLYQEFLLPNLCYVGGGGELAYWLELREFFAESGIAFPMLLLRNSALLVSAKQQGKAEKLGLEVKSLFRDPDRLVEQRVREISEIPIDFSTQRRHLTEQFEALYRMAEQTDKSFLGAVRAEEARQLKGLDRLEKRLLKAQKRKLSDEVERIRLLRESLFPQGGLQERNRNFAEFYLEMGPGLLKGLLEAFDPLSGEFTLLVYEP
jgi:bacillithiol biosynthesis cysteine-adding enzyme BshC